MSLIKSTAGKTFRLLSDRLSRFGLRILTERSPSLQVRGFSISWSDVDPKAMSGTIYEHDHSGTRVRYFVHNVDDVIQQFHAAGKWFDEPELDMIAKYYNGGTFIDVGANVGNHSLYAALILKAPKVISFEPIKVSYNICLFNMLLNRLEQVTVENFGLSDHEGFATVVQAPNRNSGATRLEAGAGGHICLRKGDDALKDERLGFVKIDVEGGEMATLRGLTNLIKRDRPIMHVEVDNENSAAFDEFCRENEYFIAHRVDRETNANLLVVAA